ncbi:alpha-1,4-digalacturonate transport system substrate-binding protein [Curtobacterium sp. PhB130]|uniref:extracellular solute-binding protein n=1 Tax=unclassified Curtobacterium TaxID=257496 RepID=UPI000F4B06D4|nr:MULTISPECIES: extracellular solute-binding protein [unclassified Curtobacterium]ROS74629.1 alpha-1,4-digalacturonate transport system substrate-binding protein [Curtobacterium sp. PhB130]TCK59292.1 alpha-1,4-digalacturonate transport system substrate-binding protein [Curtobacterium sp. PhB136]
MKSSKRVLALAGGLAALALLAGCASGSSGDSGGKVDQLTFWLSTSTAQEKGYQDLATAYEKKTGVDVKIVNLPYDGLQTKLRESAQAKSLPDVVRAAGIDPIWTSQTVDLSSIVDDDANKIDKDLIVKDADGGVTSIPSDVTAAGLFVNKTLFDKAGVSYPTDPAKAWTWDEFLKAADQVKAKTGAKYDLTFDSSPSRLRAYMFEKGTDFMQQKKDGSFPTDAKTVSALQDFADMNDDSTMPKSVWTSGQDPNALFKSGQVVAYFSGVWQTSDFASNVSFDWASAATPADPTHATDINAGGNIVGFANSDARGAAAKKFIAFMYQPDNYTKLSATNGFLPVESGLTIDYPFTSQAAKDSFALYQKEIEAADPISSSWNQESSKWATEGKELGTDPTTAEVGKLINGQQSAKTTLENITKYYKEHVG